MDKPKRYEPLWHIEIVVFCAVLLQLTLADVYSIGPKYLIGTMEILLMISLRLMAPIVHDVAGRLRRFAGLLLIGIIAFANITSLVLVMHKLIEGGGVTGKQLITSGFTIYLTNIILFGLLYWELDGGGPGGRGTHKPPVDFLFPQMSIDETITRQPNWQPSFIDYLFISTTNGAAFSPTDAMPLTHRAKMLMTIQALASLTIIVLLAARAMTILT